MMADNSEHLQPCIFVVSGLPRSGTSMACRMLAASGLEVLSDDLRTPDRHNPLGYFEYERVKRLREDSAWLERCGGKTVKVISHLLVHLPSTYRYKVVFMLRPLGEVLESQRKMLLSRGKACSEADQEFLALKFAEHLREARTWLARNPAMQTIYLDYRQVVSRPRDQAAALAEFLGIPDKAPAMARAVEPDLYRNRQV